MKFNPDHNKQGQEAFLRKLQARHYPARFFNGIPVNQNINQKTFRNDLRVKIKF